MQKASHEWWNQRLTACIMVAASLFAFGLMALFKIKKHSLLDGFFSIMTSPFGAIFCIIAVFSIMHHGAIGMKIIIEDYVTNAILQKIIINLIFLFSYFVIGILTLTIITINIKYAILHH